MTGPYLVLFIPIVLLIIGVWSLEHRVDKLEKKLKDGEEKYEN